MNNRITLTIPGDHRYLSTLRLATAAAVSTLEMGVDDVEDVKVAVSEAALQILHHHPQTVTMTLELEPAEVKATMVGVEPQRVESEGSMDLDMGRMILESLMDEVTMKPEQIMFRKVMEHDG